LQNQLIIKYLKFKMKTLYLSLVIILYQLTDLYEQATLRNLILDQCIKLDIENNIKIRSAQIA